MKDIMILIVEDDAFSRHAMEKVLQVYNYSAHARGLGQEAMEELKRENFDVLFTDFRMPGMNGIELIREAKLIQPDIQTVLMTGETNEDVKRQAESAGVDGFFPTPIAWDDLILFLDSLGEVKACCTRSSLAEHPFELSCRLG